MKKERSEVITLKREERRMIRTCKTGAEERNKTEGDRGETRGRAGIRMRGTGEIVIRKKNEKDVQEN